MTKMPKKFAKNENGMKINARDFTRPKIVTPNSSGSGEAMMNAATNGENQRKSLRWKIWANFSDPRLPIKAIKSFVKRSRTNLKRIKSPSKAPSPPKKAVQKIGLV